MNNPEKAAPKDNNRNIMNNKGFTKKETILIISLTIFFLGISLMNLKKATKNKQLDNQVKVMNEDFEAFRKISMLQKKRSAVWIGPDEYVFKTYSSLGENMADPDAGAIVESRPLRHEIRNLKSGVAYGFDISRHRVEFDPRGLSSNISGNRLDIVLWPVNLNAEDNCFVVYPMRTEIGRMADEKTCKPR